MPSTTVDKPETSPGPKSVPHDRWHAIQRLAFQFTRRVRHDMGNVVGSVELMQMMASMSGPDDPELVEAREQIGWEDGSELNVARRLHTVYGDMAWLSQAANPAAYEPARPRRLDQLLSDAITSRSNDHPAAAKRPDSETGAIWVLELGEMLRAALGVFAYQWCPAESRCPSPKLPIRTPVERGVELRFEAVEPKPCQVASPATPCDCAGCLDRNPGCEAGDMAICLARHVVAVHGGTTRFEPDDARPRLLVKLRTAG